MSSWLERFFFTIIWIFFILIIGFALLHWLSNFGGGIGNIANWIGKKSEY